MGLLRSLIFLNYCCGITVKTAKILGVFPMPSCSHNLVYRPLMTSLASRGHEVLVLTVYPDRELQLSNYREIKIAPPYEQLITRLDVVSWKERFVPRELRAFKFYSVCEDLCRIQLNIPEVQQLIRSNSSFDIIIMEWILAQPSMVGFLHKFPSSLIGISSLAVNAPAMDLLGNPSHTAYIPEYDLPYGSHTFTFWERVHLTMYVTLKRLYWYFFVIPRHDAIAREFFGDDMPYLGCLLSNISLLLINQHFSTAFPRPNVPAVIELGGMHLQKPKHLPKDLKHFLDGAVSGAIYFSFGTNVKGDVMTPEKRQMFVDVFAELPHFRVLWKYEGDSIPGLPKNVMIRKWFPQQDVLAHPKVKLFIYQGGLQSTEEAIQAEVPVIGIPFLADQDLNVKRMEAVGGGLFLDYKYLNKERLLEAIEEIMYNSSYEENMKKLNNIVNDQPETPLDRAIWWTEYVIRHKGARHLRSPALDLTWYEYLLLDVIAFLAAVLVLTIWLMNHLIKLVSFSALRVLKTRTTRN